MKNQFMINNQNFMNINQNLLMTQTIMFNINSVDFRDCFLYNQKTECFTGENAMYCNYCKNTLPSYYQSFLYTSPEILIIILNRGKGCEFNVKYEFEEYLNLYDYVQRKEFGYEYNLIGVVTHMGESGVNGHFISFNKSPIDKNWYQYNDEYVSKVNNFKKEIIDYEKPCILFYQKINYN